MGNRYFKPGSAAFNCRNCGRLTRDVEGSNGNAQLCVDCNEGFMQENGAADSSDSELIAQYEKGMHECFQKAVNKGGKIDGYSPSKGARRV